MFNSLTPNLKLPYISEYTVPGYGACWVVFNIASGLAMVYTKSAKLYRFLVEDGAIPVYEVEGCCIISKGDRSTQAAVMWGEYYAKRLRAYDSMNRCASLMSSKKACEEFGLTKKELIAMIEDGRVLGSMVDGGSDFVVSMQSLIDWKGMEEPPPPVQPVHFTETE